MQPTITQEYRRGSLMLWFDASPDPITEKVQVAARYFLAKYQVQANHAQIRPEDYPAGQDELNINGINVVKNSKLMPNHLYIGRISL